MTTTTRACPELTACHHDRNASLYFAHGADPFSLRARGRGCLMVFHALT